MSIIKTSEVPYYLKDKSPDVLIRKVFAFQRKYSHKVSPSIVRNEKENMWYAWFQFDLKLLDDFKESLPRSVNVSDS